MNAKKLPLDDQNLTNQQLLKFSKDIGTDLIFNGTKLVASNINTPQDLCKRI